MCEIEYPTMKRKFINNEFYHLVNKGIDNRKIYLNNGDYMRFIENLYEFNNAKPAKEFSRRSNKDVGNRDSHLRKQDNRNKLIKIHSFILMPNHYHLLVEQAQKDGISTFMRKLNVGYTHAFNKKAKRSGYLFQGRFKHVHIKSDIHVGFLICYLHTKPLDSWKKNWREKKLNDNEIKQALKFLEKYKYSTHKDYQGIKSYSSTINKEFLLEFFDGTKGYKEFLADWLKNYQKNIKHIKDLIISKSFNV